MMLKLTNAQIEQWLYYETGFEQLHPLPHIIDWMQQHGYRYHDDWQCVRRMTKTNRSGWELHFPNKQIQTMFVLRWS
jgi:hypothetical protein